MDLGTVCVMGRSRVPFPPIRATARIFDRPFYLRVSGRACRPRHPSNAPATETARSMLSAQDAAPKRIAPLRASTDTRVTRRPPSLSARATDLGERFDPLRSWRVERLRSTAPALGCYKARPPHTLTRPAFLRLASPWRRRPAPKLVSPRHPRLP